RRDLGCGSDAQLRGAPLCVQGGEEEGRGGNRDWPLSRQDGAALHRIEYLEGPPFCLPGASRLWGASGGLCHGIGGVHRPTVPDELAVVVTELLLLHVCSEPQ